MGRKTYLSIPERFRPLRNRLNIVITSSPGKFEDAQKSAFGFRSLSEALEALSQGKGPMASVENIFVIGGAQLYAEAIDDPLC